MWRHLPASLLACPPLLLATTTSLPAQRDHVGVGAEIRLTVDAAPLFLPAK